MLGAQVGRKPGRPRLARSAVALTLGLTAAVAAYLGLRGQTLLVEMFSAAITPSSWLPPPTSTWVRGVTVALAGLVGASVASHFFRKPPRSARGPLLAVLLTSALILVTAFSVQGYEARHREQYLREVPPGLGDRSSVLAAGYQACSWLAHEHWGAPDGPQEELYSQSVQPLLSVRRTSTNSTDTWYARYLDHLDAERPGPLTPAEHREATLTYLAWYDLCPFTRWVHRPLGYHGSRGGSDDPGHPAD